MTQQSLFKKSVATLIGFLLIISLMLCFAPNNDANADEIIWEQIDYEKHLTETSPDSKVYSFSKNKSPYFPSYRYLYIFLAGSGGLGGASTGNDIGYGGGSGGFLVVKIDVIETDELAIILGSGGGKFKYEHTADLHEDGEGGPSSIWAARYKTEQKPLAFEILGTIGGKPGNDSAPGLGGTIIKDDLQKYSLMKLLYSQNGADGGQASHSFSVDLGFRTEHFIYRPMGAYPSGKGGGASVFHRGGDGGVMFKNGSDGLMGAGGGGAGKGASQGGFGGDAYMEVYGSNM